MRRFAWAGWLVAALMLTLNATSGLAAPLSNNPLEGYLLQHSSGAWYVFHDGVKFNVQVASMGDLVIDAIPLASAAQWQTLFRAASPLQPGAPEADPTPFPGYS